MKCIELGKANKKLLIPVLGGIFLLICVSIIRKMPKYEVNNNNPFIINIYVSIGMILSFIPYLILKTRIKKPNYISKALRAESKIDIHLIYNKGLKNRNFQKYLLIFCSEVFDFVQIYSVKLIC